jgi:exodeoxyribonuclease VII small subunit
MSEQKPVAEMSFEEAIKEFESVVAALDRGDVPLEDSIKLYKRGAELRAHCEARLKGGGGAGRTDHARRQAETPPGPSLPKVSEPMFQDALGAAQTSIGPS